MPTLVPSTLIPINSGSSVSLIQTLRRALVERRQVVEIGEFKFRFLQRNDEFEDDGKHIQALAAGVFAKFPVTRGNVAAGGRWLHLGSSDDLEILLTPYLPKAEKDRDALIVGIGFNAVMKDIAKERRVLTHRRPTPFDG